MSDLATVIAQLSGNQQPAADPAMAAVKLARASIDALVLKLGQTIDAKVVGQLAAGLTQLSAGDESFVLTDHTFKVTQIGRDGDLTGQRADGFHGCFACLWR